MEIEDSHGKTNLHTTYNRNCRAGIRNRHLNNKIMKSKRTPLIMSIKRNPTGSKYPYWIIYENDYKRIVRIIRRLSSELEYKLKKKSYEKRH